MKLSYNNKLQNTDYMALIGVLTLLCKSEFYFLNDFVFIFSIVIVSLYYQPDSAHKHLQALRNIMLYQIRLF